MTQAERIKELRKEHLHLTLEQFGDRIGVTKMTISRIENGVNAVTDQMFRSICREFNVSEGWLRDGEGEPFLKMDDEDVIMEAVGRIMSEDSTRRRVIAFLSKMPPDKWELLETLAHEMYDAIKKD